MSAAQASGGASAPAAEALDAEAAASPAQQQQQQQQQQQRQEQQQQQRRLCKPTELSFQTIVDLMSALRRLANYENTPAQGGRRKKNLNKADVKKKYFKKFIDDNIVRESGEAFQVFRFFMPYVSEGERRRSSGRPSAPQPALGGSGASRPSPPAPSATKQRPGRPSLSRHRRPCSWTTASAATTGSRKTRS